MQTDAVTRRDLRLHSRKSEKEAETHMQRAHSTRQEHPPLQTPCVHTAHTQREHCYQQHRNTERAEEQVQLHVQSVHAEHADAHTGAAESAGASSSAATADTHSADAERESPSAASVEQNKRTSSRIQNMRVCLFLPQTLTLRPSFLTEEH